MMKILILEDEDVKSEQVSTLLTKIDPTMHVHIDTCLRDFISSTSSTKYDLIIADLCIPLFNGGISKDETETIINHCRDHNCVNFYTTIVALTQYNSIAEERFIDLNSKDIWVITYDPSKENWMISLQNKVLQATPKITYDFTIICALDKEADAFKNAGYAVGQEKMTSTFRYRDIEIGCKKGVIITCPRMGLVTAAIITTQVIELFEPTLVCMSGICAGIEGKADIYDVIIPKLCQQHDSGKWTDAGFIPELYSIPIDHQLQIKIESIINQEDFKGAIDGDIKLFKSEYPADKENLDICVRLAAASSGSAVIASDEMNQIVTEQHRKMTAFEMESYAVYEAARVSKIQPKFFSAKSVVDNGKSNKGDNFHRVASILSAKVVYEIIKRGII